MIHPKVIFVSGPRGAGKTSLIRMMAREAMVQRPHHLRVVARCVSDRPHLQLVQKSGDPELASTRRVEYEPDRSGEIIDDAIRNLPLVGHPNIVMIEGDGDPCLRYAYPYDRRIFVMPAPGDVYDVFRTPEQAATALRKVMEDTASFATEIFGLFDEDQIEQETGFMADKPAGGWSWDRPADGPVEVDEIDLRRFLDSPIGVEIASRIQLQPEYQGLVEGDVIVLNTGVGAQNGVLDEVNRRLELLLNRIRSQAQNDGLLFCCDVVEPSDPRRARLFEKLSLMHHALAS